ncbi:MAG: LptE family protein [Syntrophobacteria bacterium]|jgi:outer membrane lipopolysaccharide assembly protein LptE/RlpB
MLWCKPFLDTGTRRLPAVLAVLLATFLLLLGCGYHLAGTGGQAPGDIQSIAVNVLSNQTAEIGIETIFTNAILNEFIRWKRLSVKPPNEAEAVLVGSVARIKTQTASHLTRSRTLETRVTVTLSLALIRVDTDEVLWQNKKLSYYDEYVEAGNALNTARFRREAFRRIAEFLAEKIHQNMFEEF